MSKPRVGIINVTGYAGVELARLLAAHPNVSLSSVTGRSAAGQALEEVFPHLAGTGLDITTEMDEVDFAFAALPIKKARTGQPASSTGGIKVVDISADYRLRDAALYPEWYGFDHPAPTFSGQRFTACRSDTGRKLAVRAWWPIPAATPPGRF